MPVLDDAVRHLPIPRLHAAGGRAAHRGLGAARGSRHGFPAGNARRPGLPRRRLPQRRRPQRRSRTRRSPYLINEFDNNIYPKESATFSVPPTRDGTNAQLPGARACPDDYYVRRRRQHRHARRQRPRRQLLRHEQRAPHHVHRRVLLVADQRVLRSQRDDDRRVRLAAPDRREPAGRPVRRTLHERAGAPAPLRGRVRPRVPAPARAATRTRTRSTGSTRASPTGRRR